MFTMLWVPVKDTHNIARAINTSECRGKCLNHTIEEQTGLSMNTGTRYLMGGEVCEGGRGVV